MSPLHSTIDHKKTSIYNTLAINTLKWIYPKSLI